MIKVKPKFQHDCEDCVFLGHFMDHDLYWAGHALFPGFVFRYGNKGPEYLTAGVLSQDKNPLRIHALSLAAKYAETLDS